MRKIFFRLGYRPRQSNLDSAQIAATQKIVQQAAALCEPQGVYRQDLVKVSNQETCIKRGLAWTSQDLARFLQGCQQIFLVAVTVGPAIIKQRDSLFQNNNSAHSVIYDAVGSEMVEATADWLQNYLRLQVSRRRQTLTKFRYSPGYGDFGLENQKEIYSSLNLDQMGLELTNSGILVPEKSITAIIGIKNLP